MAKKHAPLPAAALFFPFDRTPPDGQHCLDRVYDVFADWPIQWGWCTRCFTPEHEARMRRHPDVRTAPHDGFDMIYYEHPSCSGGATTFLHWLPRGLEISFLDDRLYQSFRSQITQLGLLAWPERLLAPLRQLLCRASINWFTKGDPFPLRHDHEGPLWMSDDEIGSELILMLCTLRVEPKSIADWLIEIDTPASWRPALLLLKQERILEDIGYYALPNNDWQGAFIAAQEALDRRLRADFHAAFSDAVLLGKWEKVAESDPDLAALIAQSEWERRIYGSKPEGDTRLADDEAIRRVTALPVPGG